MKGLLQRANCPSCGKPFGLLLTFQVMAWPESFVRCRHCGQILYLAGSIYFLFITTTLLIWIAIIMATIQIFQIFFASAAEYIRIILLIVVGIGGFFISEVIGSQVILLWIAKQKD